MLQTKMCSVLYVTHRVTFLFLPLENNKLLKKIMFNLLHVTTVVLMLSAASLGFYIAYCTLMPFIDCSDFLIVLNVFYASGCDTWILSHCCLDLDLMTIKLLGYQHWQNPCICTFTPSIKKLYLIFQYVTMTCTWGVNELLCLRVKAEQLSV